MTPHPGAAPHLLPRLRSQTHFLLPAPPFIGAPRTPPPPANCRASGPRWASPPANGSAEACSAGLPAPRFPVLWGRAGLGVGTLRPWPFVRRWCSRRGGNPRGGPGAGRPGWPGPRSGRGGMVSLSERQGFPLPPHAQPRPRPPLGFSQFPTSALCRWKPAPRGCGGSPALAGFDGQWVGIPWSRPSSPSRTHREPASRLQPGFGWSHPCLHHHRLTMGRERGWRQRLHISEPRFFQHKEARGLAISCCLAGAWWMRKPPAT